MSERVAYVLCTIEKKEVLVMIVSFESIMSGGCAIIFWAACLPGWLVGWL